MGSNILFSQKSRTLLNLVIGIGIRINKTKDWTLVQNAALVMKIKVLKLGFVG